MPPSGYKDTADAGQQTDASRGFSRRSFGHVVLAYYSHHGISKPDSIANREFNAPDYPAIDRRAVSGFHVLEKERLPDLPDYTVPARDFSIGEADAIGHLAAERVGAVVEAIDGSRLAACFNQ